MKLCFVSNSFSLFRGGHTRNFRLLAEALAKRGHVITLLCVAGKDDELSGSTCHKVFIKPKCGPAMLGFARAVDTWISEQREAFDLVHFNGYYVIPYAFRPKDQRSLTIRHLRGTNWTIFRAAYNDDFFKWNPKYLRYLMSCLFCQKLDVRSFYACDHIITNSSETMIDTKFKDSVPEAKMSILYNGVRVPALLPNNKELIAFRKSKGLGNGYIISCLANLYFGKGWGYLLRIAGALRRMGIKFTLLIMGDGPLGKFVRSDVVRNGLADCTHFTGPIRGEEEKMMYLCASDLFLYPSSPGTTVLEALSLGVPIVIARRRQDCSAGMDWGPLNRLGVGKVVYDLLPEEVASILIPIIANKDRLGSDSGVEYCRQELSWDRIATQAETIYMNLLEMA